LARPLEQSATQNGDLAKRSEVNAKSSFRTFDFHLLGKGARTSESNPLRTAIRQPFAAWILVKTEYNNATFSYRRRPVADGSFLHSWKQWIGSGVVGDSNSKSQILKRMVQAFEPSLPTEPSQSALRYALAVLVAIAALLLRKALVPLLGDQDPYHIAWLAVAFSAWYCGFWQSVLALAIEAIGVWYWLLPPHETWRIRDRSDV
jgi:hypothetical protein